MAQKRQKKQTSAIVEGRRVAARVAERERMEALWREARELAEHGEDVKALKVLERARRLAEKLKAEEDERLKWPGKRRRE